MAQSTVSLSLRYADMLAKSTPKNQPRIQRSNTVRAKLAKSGLQERDLADAMQWARQTLATKSSKK